MGKFESYPEANALGDNDITLYNKNTVTHKITFSRLVNLIKDKIAQTGLVTSISTGAGLVGNTITSSGTIKCKLKSETVSSLSSVNPTIIENRQYAVGLDREGYLSVNVPWTENSTYSSGTAIDITNETINVILDNTYSSSSTVKAASAKALKDAYDNSMRKDGSNANAHVHFNNALTVGTTRKLNSTIGSSSVCFGYGNIASESDSFASGAYTEASEFASHSEGYGTDQPNYTNSPYGDYDNNATANIAATAYGSHAEGYATYDEQSGITGIIQANGMGSHAEGYAEGGQGDGVIIAHGKGSHAEGYADSAIIGDDCANIAHGNGSHVEGIGTYASGDGSHAEGIICTANGESSHAEGYNTITNGQNSHAEGKDTTTYGSYSHAEGQSTQARGDNSHAEGSCGVASGVGSHVEGGVLKGSPQFLGLYESQDNDTKIVKTTDTSFISGKSYYPTPFAVTPTGNENPSQKNWLELQSVGVYIHSTDTTVNPNKTYYDYYRIFGDTESQSASGYFAHAEGNHTIASGYYSHTEGRATIASGCCSHAEGDNTTASGNSSHAEGWYAIASGTRSHAEGERTLASGIDSHAEGAGTEATGDASHAEGVYTKARGSYSHAGGAYVIASQACQLAQGGANNKFSDSTCGRGIFCVSPNTFIYHASATLSSSINGTSCTVDGGVSITLTLDKYAMYMLYWTTYSGTNDATMSSGMHLISTSATTNNPYVQDILAGNIIDSVDACSITLLDNNKYMFHLIRIL